MDKNKDNLPKVSNWFAVKSNENEEKKAIKRSAYAYFYKFLREHGPVNIEDPVLQSKFELLEPETKEIILESNSVTAFLLACTGFSMIDNYIGITTDTVKTHDIAKRQSTAVQVPLEMNSGKQIPEKETKSLSVAEQFRRSVLELTKTDHKVSPTPVNVAAQFKNFVLDALNNSDNNSSTSSDYVDSDLDIVANHDSSLASVDLNPEAREFQPLTDCSFEISEGGKNSSILEQDTGGIMTTASDQKCSPIKLCTSSDNKIGTILLDTMEAKRVQVVDVGVNTVKNDTSDTDFDLEVFKAESEMMQYENKELKQQLKEMKVYMQKTISVYQEENRKISKKLIDKEIVNITSNSTIAENLKVQILSKRVMELEAENRANARKFMDSEIRSAAKNSAETENKKMSKKINEVETENKRLSKKLNELEQENKKLIKKDSESFNQASKELVEVEYLKLMKKQKEAEAENKKLQKKIIEVDAEMSKVRETVQDFKTEEKKRISYAIVADAKRAKKFEALHTKIQTLEQQHKEKDANIKTILEEQTRLNSDVQKKKEELKKLNKKLDSVTNTTKINIKQLEENLDKERKERTEQTKKLVIDYETAITKLKLDMCDAVYDRYIPEFNEKANVLRITTDAIKSANSADAKLFSDSLREWHKTISLLHLEKSKYEHAAKERLKLILKCVDPTKLPHLPMVILPIAPSWPLEDLLLHAPKQQQPPPQNVPMLRPPPLKTFPEQLSPRHTLPDRPPPLSISSNSSSAHVIEAGKQLANSQRNSPTKRSDEILLPTPADLLRRDQASLRPPEFDPRIFRLGPSAHAPPDRSLFSIPPKAPLHLKRDVSTSNFLPNQQSSASGWDNISSITSLSKTSMWDYDKSDVPKTSAPSSAIIGIGGLPRKQTYESSNRSIVEGATAHPPRSSSSSSFFSDSGLPTKQSTNSNTNKTDNSKVWIEESKNPSFMPMEETHARASVVLGATSQSDVAPPKKKSDKLMALLQHRFPNVVKEDILTYLKEIRRVHGTLNGLGPEGIVREIAVLKDKSNTGGVMGLDLFGRPGVVWSASDNGDCASTVSWSGRLGEECAICYELLEEKQTAKLMCKHVFHSDCLQKWFKESRTCPTCRVLAFLPDDYPALN